MADTQAKSPLPVIGMIAMGGAAITAAVVSWVGWPDMADTLEEVLGPNNRPSVATKGTVAVGIPVLLSVLALLPWPLLRVDARHERRSAPDYRLSAGDRSRRARALSLVWCALAIVLLALHVYLVGAMVGRTVLLFETLAVSFGIFLLAFAAAIPYTRRDPATVRPELRRLTEGFARGYRRTIPIWVVSGVATIALGVFWSIVALGVGGIGMCAAIMIAALSGVQSQ
ncbi:hypothetical protein [Rhodococcus sp. (in: high G+C Gram-positive bacteria)]|uniref:hypothetical protein n=1 Tax=Rhodococcus sp. TaxID=1831 RepID=UPI003B8A7CD3